MTQNPVVYLTQKLWQYSAGNRRNVVAYSVMFCFANAIDFLRPLLVGAILNTLQTQGVTNGNISAIFVLVVSFLGLTLGFWVFHGFARVIENNNAFHVRANYKKYLLDGVMALPLGWHTNHHSGNTIDKIEKGTVALFVYSRRTYEVIQSLMLLIGSYFALAYFNIHSAYIVFGMIVITVWTVIRFDRGLIVQYRHLNRAENTISEKIYDAISNITTVVILRIEKLVSESIFKKILKPYRVYAENNRVNELKWFLVALSGTVMTILVLGSYLYASYASGATLLAGTVYILYGYIDRINGLFFRFAGMYGEIVIQRTAVLNAEEVSKEFTSEVESKPFKLPKRWKEIVVQNLVFSYDSDEDADLHLDGISLSIKNGERVAFIGESGSGKTTLLKVIRELSQPNAVEVFLDGEPLPQGFQTISSHIALIPQDPEIFSTTILENITMGVPHSAAHIAKYIEMACFEDVVERLPKKLESSIVEKGVNLSGGERQRLALARGLLACEQKSIVLLDEPTSSVDLKNEMAIYQNIFREFKDKAILSSVHRIHLLPLFDTIYYFRAGKVVASGSFDDLLEHSKPFQRLWNKFARIQDVSTNAQSDQ